MTADSRRLLVDEGDAGQRLDRFLGKLLGVPITTLFRALRKREITLDGRRAAPNARVEAGAVIEFHGRATALLGEPAPAVEAPREPWAGPRVAVLYRDPDVVAVAKPAGLNVQPGHGPSLGDWIESADGVVPAQRSRTFRPGPAHRLDRSTSGVVLIGASAAGLRGLNAAFRDGRVEKVYLALVRGVPDPPEASIRSRLRVLDPAPPRGPKTVADPEGLDATSHYRVLADRGDHALLEVGIETGRTHQIRAHLAGIGHPLRGDRRYGGGAGELLLHAWRVTLDHPITGARLSIEAPPPVALCC